MSQSSTRWLTAEQQKVWRTYLLGSARLNERLDADLRAVRARSTGVRDPGHAGGVARPAPPDVRARRRRAPVPLAADPHHRPDGEAGLVERTTCPTDRRGVWAELTDAGFEVLAEGRPGPRRRRPPQPGRGGAPTRTGKRSGACSQPCWRVDRRTIHARSGRDTAHVSDRPGSTTMPTSTRRSPTPARCTCRRTDPALRRRGVGDVLDTTKLTRALYSSDASVYRVVPAGGRPATVGRGAAGGAGRGAGARDAGHHPGRRHLVRRQRGRSGPGHRRRPPPEPDPRGRPRGADSQSSIREWSRPRCSGQAAPYGLRFGPDPSTHTRCTIGGMIGNNACGPRALGYGKTADNVIALEVVTGSGERLTAGRRSDRWTSTPRRRCTPCSRWCSAHLGTIRTEFGTFGRQVSGYSLEHLLPETEVRRRPVPGRHRGHPGGDHQGDRPAGRRRAAQDHDRARLRVHGRGGGRDPGPAGLHPDRDRGAGPAHRRGGPPDPRRRRGAAAAPR